MVWGGSQAEDTGQSNAQTLEYLINFRINKMIDAKEQKDWWKYFVNFEFLYQRLLPYMETEDRMCHECEWRYLAYLEKKIRNDTTINDTTRETKILELKREFAEGHMAYLYLLFPKAGLATIKESGEIDFTKMRWDALRSFIQDGGGTPSGLEYALDRQKRMDEKDEQRLNGVSVRDGIQVRPERGGGKADSGSDKADVPGGSLLKAEGTGPARKDS
jgi:hypothetical protein